MSYSCACGNISLANSLIKRFKSLPFLRKPYSNELLQALDNNWNNLGITINEKNEIVLPLKVKNLTYTQLNINRSESLLKAVKINVNILFNQDFPKLDDKFKPDFWIEYDSNNEKKKVVLYSLKKIKIIFFIILNLLELRINLN